MNLHHKILNIHVQKNHKTMLNIQKVLQIHRKIKKIHHKILHTHHKIMKYTSQDIEHTKQNVEYISQDFLIKQRFTCHTGVRFQNHIQDNQSLDHHRKPWV